MNCYGRPTIVRGQRPANRVFLRNFYGQRPGKMAVVRTKICNRHSNLHGRPDFDETRQHFRMKTTFSSVMHDATNTLVLV